MTSGAMIRIDNTDDIKGEIQPSTLREIKISGTKSQCDHAASLIQER